MTIDARSQEKPASSHVRWIIVVLLVWVAMANYLDRAVLANLAPEMPQYLQLADKVKAAEVDLYWKQHSSEVLAAVRARQQRPESDAATWEECQALMKAEIARKSWDEAYWNIQIGFTAAYAIGMLFMGRLVDLLGLRWGFAFACGVWTVAAMLQAVAPEIGGLFGNITIGFFLCRILLGLGEGGLSPAAIKTIAEWFPRRERALATGFSNGASSLGGMLVPWALPIILVHFSALAIGGSTIGWRATFLVTSVIDLTWIAAWLIYYKDPDKHSGVSGAELAHIQDKAVEPTAKIPWRKLLPYKQTWAFVGAKVLTDPFWGFYLYSAADFFNKKFSLGPADRKYMIMMIYVVSAIGAVAGGWLAGRFMRLGWTVNRARKTTMLICSLMVVPVFYAAVTGGKWIAAGLITLAAAGHQAWGANVYSLAGDMFPRRVVGSVVGIAGLFSTVSTMCLLFATGKILKLTGSYLPIFVAASAAYALAMVLVQCLAPKMKPINIDDVQQSMSIGIGAASVVFEK